MANSKQSEKRARQNQTRRIRGQAIRSRYRTMVKKVRAAATVGDADTFRAAYVAMQAAADGAVSKNLLHRNTVSRIKRRLNRLSPTANSATAGAAAGADAATATAKPVAKTAVKPKSKPKSK